MAQFQPNDVYIVDAESGKKIKLGKISSVEITPEGASETEQYWKELTTMRDTIECSIGFNLSMSSRRLLAGVIAPCLASNNWRKHHGMTMWRR